MNIADRYVLRRWDLGREWHPYDFAKDRVVSREAACLRYDDEDLDVTASRYSSFSAGGTTLIVGGKSFIRSTYAVISSVNLFETEAQARDAFSRIARSLRGRPILGCLYEAESVRHGPTIERVSASYFLIGKQFPRLADETWRQQYEVRIEGGTEKTWIDIVLLRADRAIAVAFFSSEEGKPFPLPLSNDFVQRIAQRLAGRLSG